MVTPAFLRALAFTTSPEIEGGYSNHPQDRGGPTNHGITQRTYDNWRTTTGKEKRMVDLIDDYEVSAIYHDDYWVPCNCEQLPEPLSIAVFDMAVNSGTWNAKLTLQRALNVKADGIIGPVTLRAAKATPNVTLRFLEKRGAFIQEILYARPGQVAFLEGWIKRLLRLAVLRT